MKISVVPLALLAVLATQPAFAQSQNSAPRKNFPNPNDKPLPPPWGPGGTDTVSHHHHHHHKKPDTTDTHSKS